MVGEDGADTVFKGEGGDVGEGDEEAPFEEEDARGGQDEDPVVAEDPPVGQHVFDGWGWFGGGESGADEDIGHDAEAEEDESLDADGPCKAKQRKQTLQHQRKYYASNATTCGG